MHSRHAFLPLWDDHEFRNNYDKTGWTFPGVVRPRHPAVVQQKKAWAYRAWFEHMPVPRFAGDPLRTYRSLRLGRTVELFAEDSRQYRDDQGCHDSIDHIVCTSADEPGRSMLGSTQLSWLTNGLRTSSARWKLLANQNMLVGMVVAGNGTRAWMDSWDGYGAERTTLLSSVAGKVSDFVVVTGDDHDGYAGELWNTGFAPGTTSGAQVNPAGAQRAGVEFVVPSLTSTNTGDGGVPAARTEEQNRRGHNPHVKYADMVAHGYGILEAGPSDLRMDFRTVHRLDANAPVTTTATFHVPHLGQRLEV